MVKMAAMTIAIVRVLILLGILFEVSLSLSDDEGGTWPWYNSSARYIASTWTSVLVTVGLGAVVITILSQGDAYHSARAREQREQWLQQLSSSAAAGGQVSACRHQCTC